MYYEITYRVEGGMGRILSDCGDYEGACKYINGDERRLVRMIEACADQLMQIMGGFDESADKYIIGICKQAGYPVYCNGPTYLMDIAATQLFAVFQMLDTHRRRLIKKEEHYTGRLAFDVGASYVRNDGGLFMVTEEEIPHPHFFKVKSNGRNPPPSRRDGSLGRAVA